MTRSSPTIPMADWTYRKIDLNDLPRKRDDIDALNDAGLEGWELVAILPNNVALLKRQLEDLPLAQPQQVRSPRRKAPTTPK